MVYVYRAQNYWVLGLFPSPGVFGSRNTTFQKLELFPTSGEAREKIPTQLGPLEGTNLNPLTFYKGPN
jgi:hypothetical protein